MVVISWVESYESGIDNDGGVSACLGLFGIGGGVTLGKLDEHAWCSVSTICSGFISSSSEMASGRNIRVRMS